MITEIGIGAGEVWHYLDSHGRVKLEEVFTNIDKPRELLLMSIGWLAREGHVLLQDEGGRYYICLRNN